MVDNNIGYQFAGPGAKRRQRLETTTEPRHSKPAPSQQRPEPDPRKTKLEERTEALYSVMGVKTAIRLLVIERDASVDDIVEAMRRGGCAVSKLAISNLRADMREVLKLLEKEGLLDTAALARRRRKIRARDCND